MKANMKIRIGKKSVGCGNPCFVIAEAGVNHNGDIKLAKRLVDVAKDAAADAVKFQTFRTQDLVARNTKAAFYQKKTVPGLKTQNQILQALELWYDDFVELKRYCDKKQIIFLSTAHTQDAVDLLDSLVCAYKIASGDLTNLPFLEAIAERQKTMILSTGMSTLQEVRQAVDCITKKHNRNIVLLHCTTNYPCSLEEVNLRAMQTLRKEFNLPVGYSDHTLGLFIPPIAVGLGAAIIEKHFTLDKNSAGPDHKASLDPGELKIMVRSIRDTEKALGSAMKIPSDSEKKIMKLVRKSLVAAADIHKGSKIKEGDISIKRPGSGIQPKDIKRIIGKKALKDIKKDELLAWSLIK